MALSVRTVAVTLTAKVDGFVGGMKKASAAVNDLTKADVNKPAQAFDNLSTKAALLGGAVALGVGAAVKSFMDFDKQMSAAGAATQTTGDAFDSLRKAAIDAGNATQFSATDAARAITEMGKAGVSTSDILGGGLTGALALAAAGQLDVGAAGEIAATALNQFNLTGKDLPHVADLLAAGAGKAQGSVEDLSLALNYVGPVAHSMGIGIEETVGVLAEFASAGLVGEKGGTAFRGMLSSLLSPSEQASKTMAQLGISLYDASGKFIGMQATAQVLHDKLGPLDEATRNQALGQIFGNQQLAAATILYQNGGQAVADWTGKVNDQGFATRQAAQLMDNLSGDVEKFTSALDTAFIQAGSGGNSALRSIVQSATDVVNGLSGIPGPVLLVGSALSALALIGPKAFLSFRQYKADLDAAGLSLDKISEKAPRVGQGLDIASKAAKGLAVAFGAAAIASRTLDGDIDQVGVEQLTRDLLSGADAAGVLDRAFAGAVGTGTNFDSNVRSVGDALRYSFDPGFLDQVDSAAGSVFATFGGKNTSDVKIAADRLKEVDTALAGLVSGGHGTEAANVMAQIQNAAAAQGISVDQLKAKFPQYAEALAAVTNSSPAAKAATDDLAGAQDKAAQSAQDAAKANDALLQSLSAYASLVLGARDAARGYQEAVDAADAALKENGKTLDITTEKGRANQKALDGIADSTLNMVTKTFEGRDANTSLADAVKTATDQVNEGRDAFIAHADRMGMDHDAAVALADQLGLTSQNVGTLSQTIEQVPKEINPQVNVDTKAATAEVEGAQRKLDALDKSSAAPTIAAQPAPFNAVIDDSDRKMAELGGAVATPTVTANPAPFNGIATTTQQWLAQLTGTTAIPTMSANPGPFNSAAANTEQRLAGLDATTVDPTLSANPSPFNSAAAGVQSKLGGLDASQANPLLSAIDHASGTISSVRSGLDSLHDKSVTVTTTYRSVDEGIRHASGGPGGPIYGPGTGTSDEAGLYALSNNEHVLTAAEVAAIGGHGEVFRLRKAMLAGRVQYAATGGPVVVPYTSLVGAPPSAPVFRVTTPPRTGRDAPLMSIGQMITADPRAAMHEADMKLRTALATNGIL